MKRNVRDSYELQKKYTELKNYTHTHIGLRVNYELSLTLSLSL